MQLESSPVQALSDMLKANTSSKSHKTRQLMEPEGSSSCSQKPTNGPYPELDESSPNLPTLFLKDPLYYYLEVNIHTYVA